MPRISHLAVACALALGAQAAQAQQFSGVITFGDSLSDAGNIGILSSGGLATSNSFTTNPDPVWAEIVANGFGFTQRPSQLVGGTNFAYGGACSRANTAGPPAFTCVNNPSGAFSLSTQLGAYLAAPARAGRADPNALYTVWAGANDIFTALGNPATAAAVTVSAAQNTVGNIAALQNAGATHIVVFNLPDIGTTPQFSNSILFPTTGGLSATLSGLSATHNLAFNAGLATLRDGIIPINVSGLVSEIRNNFALYGFTNVTGVACVGAGGVPISSVGCGPANYVTPTANNTYLFADGVHPSGAAHRMLANVVLATIRAPGQVSLAGELPLQVYQDHSGAIGQALLTNKVGDAEVGASRGFFQAQIGNQDYDASVNSPALSTNSNTFTGGFEYRYSEGLSFGAAISFGGSNGDFAGGDIDGQEVLGSAFATAHFGKGYINGVLSLGNSSIDINRDIVLGPTTRVETGNASASHKAFEVGGGFLFGDTLRHGPFLSATWQRVGVDAYAENSGTSTSMRFDGFDRDSLVGRIGYQLQGDFGGDRSIRPTLRVAYATENEDDAVNVRAGSTSMNGQFSFAGIAPSEDWIEADLSVNVEFTDKVDGFLGYHGRLSDDKQDNQSFNLGVNVAF
jgi:outer membrane lipase/esterase